VSPNFTSVCLLRPGGKTRFDSLPVCTSRRRFTDAAARDRHCVIFLWQKTDAGKVKAEHTATNVASFHACLVQLQRPPIIGDLVLRKQDRFLAVSVISPGEAGEIKSVVHPLTDPARIPRTKYRCSEKKTTSGSAIDTNAAAVRSSQSCPRLVTRLAILSVIGATLGLAPR